ncbi:MAG: hypothetical protein Q9217_004870 [Psora testacea]
MESMPIRSTEVDYDKADSTNLLVIEQVSDGTGTANDRKSNLVTAEQKGGTTRNTEGQNARAPSVQQILDTETREKSSECRVCYEVLTIETTPTKKLTSTCNHERDICKGCIMTSIREASTNNLWDNIKCPSCNARLSHEDIHEAADVETRERYADFMTKMALERGELPRIRFCKVGGCKNGQECFSEDSFMICRECTGRTCLGCNKEMHMGLRCYETAEPKEPEESVDEQDEQTQVLLKELDIKRCPNIACGILTQKIDGCDHMECQYRMCFQKGTPNDFGVA